MFCSNCGNKLNNNSNFCGKCGQSVISQTANLTQKKTKKIPTPLIAVVAIIIVIGLVVGVINNVNKNNTRTVMIYMVGADLESKNGLATVDLKAIDGSKVDLKNVNVVLMAGGSRKWDNDLIDKNETSIFELTESGFKKVQTQSVKNMGDKNIFLSYLNYVHDNYHTDKYDLIFWNHGAGIRGSEFDELNNNDNLSLLEMKEALEDSPFSSNKLELVMFRTCLNGTIEVANIFKDYADYMVASEEVTVSFGLDSSLEFINNIEKTDTGVDVGRKLVEGYQATIANGCKQNSYTGYCVNSTYAVIDLSNIKKLNTAIDDFFKDINDKLNDNYNLISRIRSNRYQYAGSDGDSFEMIDLYDIVDNLKELSPSKGQELLNIIKDTVKYNWTTNSYSNGLSVYFPYTHGYDLSKYSFIASSNNYDNFIKNFYSYKTNRQVKKFDFSKNNITAKEDDAKKGSPDFILDLTKEQTENFAKARYLLFAKYDNGYKPIRSSSDVSLNGNKLEAYVKGKQLRVKDPEDGKSYWLLLNEIERTKDYTKYKTNVVLQNFDDIHNFVMDHAEMQIIVDKDHPNGVITQITKNSTKDENGNILPSVKMENLSDYTSIAFLTFRYDILDENGNYTEEWEGKGIAEGVEVSVDEKDNIEFVAEDFSKDFEYYCIFSIWDTAGNQYYSNLVKMDN